MEESECMAEGSLGVKESKRHANTGTTVRGFPKAG